MFPYMVILVITNIFTSAETRTLVGNNLQKEIRPLQMDKTQTDGLIENSVKITKIKTVLRKLLSEEYITRKFSFKANKSTFHQLAWETSESKELLVKELNNKQNIQVLGHAKILLSTLKRRFVTQIS